MGRAVARVEHGRCHREHTDTPLHSIEIDRGGFPRTIDGKHRHTVLVMQSIQVEGTSRLPTTARSLHRIKGNYAFFNLIDRNVSSEILYSEWKSSGNHKADSYCTLSWNRKLSSKKLFIVRRFHQETQSALFSFNFYFDAFVAMIFASLPASDRHR